MRRERFALIELPVAVPTNPSPSAASAIANRVSELLANHQTILKGLVTVPERAEVEGGSSSPPALTVTEQVPINLLGDPNEFMDRPAMPIPGLPWSSLRPPATDRPLPTEDGRISARIADRTTRSGGTEGLYVTQAASLLYTPACCTNFVVEIVSRKLRNPKRERETDDRPDQQVIGYRVDSVVTRSASLALPAEFCFSLSSPEMPIRSAAFPPASFFRHQKRGAVFEMHYRYEEDDDEETRLRHKPPPTVSGTWPPTRTSPVPPNDMSPVHRKVWDRLTGMERAAIDECLALNPVWDGHVLFKYLADSGRCPRPHLLKNAISCATFTFPHGPFGRLRVKLGADPSTDPKSRFAQRLTVRLTGFSPVQMTMRELAASPYLPSVLATIKASVAEARVAIVSPESFEGTHNSPIAIMYTSGPSPIYRVPKTEYYCKLLSERREFWQIQIDQLLEEPSFVSIMNHTPINRKCDVVTGWFHPDVYERLSAFANEDFHRWLLDDVAPKVAAAAEAGDIPPMLPTAADGTANDDNDNDSVEGSDVGAVSFDDEEFEERGSDYSAPDNSGSESGSDSDED